MSDFVFASVWTILLIVVLILYGLTFESRLCVDGISYLNSAYGVKTLQVDKDGKPVQCEVKK